LQNNIFQKKLESPTEVGIVADRRLPKNAGKQLAANGFSRSFVSFSFDKKRKQNKKNFSHCLKTMEEIFF